MSRSHPLLALLVALVWGRAPHVAAADEVWPERLGALRRELRVETAEQDASATAITTVFLDNRTPGFVLADPQGAVRPCGLLQRSGSRVSFHFEARPGERLYLYPCADAAQFPAPGLSHSTGLRQLTRAYGGEEVDSVERFEALWQAATPQGGGFAEQVFSSVNPYGPNARTLHRYEGTFRIATAGATIFCTASTDASFLLVNGRLVAAWPGRHPVKPGLDGSRRGTVDLQPGTHRLTYLHANGDSPDSFAIAALIAPGEKQHRVIAPEAFTRAAYAYVGPLAGRDGQRPADFLWESRHMVTVREHALFDLSFEAAPPHALPGTSYAWDFGDGTASAHGPKVEHLYFARGDYDVRLTVTSADGRQTDCRQTVRVETRYGQNENDDARALALLERAVRQERESGIQPQGYALISHGYFFYQKEPLAAAFAERALAAADRIPPATLGPLFYELALGVQPVGEAYELAERCFKTLAERLPEGQERARSLLHYGGLLTLCLNRPQQARDLLSTLRRQDLADWESRLLDIYLADTALTLDSCAAARALYLALPKPTAVVSGSTLNRGALFDYNTRHFRLQNLLQQGLFPESLTELDLLEWEVPEERVSPRTNLLKARALAGNSQPRKAVVCLQRALLADTEEMFAPAIRLELARLHLGLGQLAHAKHQLDLLRKQYPWAQEEVDARTLLSEIERKTREIPP